MPMGKVEITMWHNSTTGDGKAYWESAAKAFEKENPNVTIKIEAIQNEDMDGKLQTALQDPNSAPISLWRVVARSYVMWSKLGKPWT